jgi:hypothetical protein
MTNNAIVITGQMRTYTNQKILNSYKMYLQPLGNFDVYIHTWGEYGKSNNHGRSFTSNYEKNKTNINDIYNHYNNLPFFDIKDIQIESFDNWINSLSSELKLIYNTPFRYHSKYTTSICINYKYQMAVNRLKMLKKKNYEKIVFLRADTEIINKIPWNDYTNNDTLYYHSENNRCIDHGWIINGNAAELMFSDIFDKYMVNYIKIPYIIIENNFTSESQANSDNNEILKYHAQQNNIRLHHTYLKLFNIII